MHKIKGTGALAALAALAIAAAPAAAADLELDRIGSSSGWLTVKLRGDNVSGTPNVYAGRFEWEVTGVGVDSPWAVGQKVYTFCTEVNENAANQQDFDLADLGDLPSSGPQMNAARQDALNALYANYYSGAETVGGSTEVYDLASAAGASRVIEGAFQMAVWEIVYGNDMSLDAPADNSSDGFYIQNFDQGGDRIAAVDIANDWLDAIFNDGLGGDAALAGLLSVAPQNGQDMLVIVPLPAAAVLGLAGLGLAGAARRRASRLA